MTVERVRFISLHVVLQVLRAGAVRATLPSAEMEQTVGAFIRLVVELT